MSEFREIPEQRDPTQKYWDPERQTMPLKDLYDLQLGRTREMLDRVIQKPVPFWKRKLEAAGISAAEDIASMRDLDRIPLTVKQELRDSEAQHPPLGDYRFFGLRDAVRLGTSTGTTGQPTITLWTKRDNFVEYETAARIFWRQGLRPGMIISHAHPAYLYVGGILQSSTFEYFGLLTMWVPPPETFELGRQGIEMWKRITPDRYSLLAAPRFVEIAAEMGLDAERDLGLKVDPPELVTAGAEALAYLGSVCEEQNGCHMAEDYAYVQVVDPATGDEVPDGAWGSMVVTTFGRDFCVLRYNLEEAFRIDRSPCPCGETMARGWWGGRLDDLLSTQGRQVWVREIEMALRGMPGVDSPTVEFVVTHPTDPDAPLALQVEAESPADSEVRARVEERLRQELQLRVDVKLLARNTLTRAAYKARRVVEP